MRAAIKREYEAIGEYPGLPSPRSALRDRVIGKPSGEYLDFSDLLIENIYDGALELLSQKVLLYAQSEPIVPPNYAVFDVVGSPATIFSFNLDGLAKRFCGKRHVVLEPHGHIDRRWLEGERYTFLRNLVAYHDIPLHHLTPKLLPSPEPPGIAQTRDFKLARSLFHRSPAVLIVGYSFGNVDGRIDDSESWRFFLDRLKAHPIPTFVLAPFPEELADILRQNLSSNYVFGVPVYWETLASCLMSAAGPTRQLPTVWSAKQLRDFMSEYRRAEQKR